MKHLNPFVRRGCSTETLTTAGNRKAVGQEIPTSINTTNLVETLKKMSLPGLGLVAPPVRNLRLIEVPSNGVDIA
jgi:hypothetical protein